MPALRKTMTLSTAPPLASAINCRHGKRWRIVWIVVALGTVNLAQTGTDQSPGMSGGSPEPGPAGTHHPPSMRPSWLASNHTGPTFCNSSTVTPG